MTDAPRRTGPVMLSEVREMRRLSEQGFSRVKIGTRLGRHRNTVDLHLGEAGGTWRLCEWASRRRRALRQQALIDACNAAIGLRAGANLTAAPLNPYP